MNYKLILASIISILACFVLGYFLIKIAPNSTKDSIDQSLSANNINNSSQNKNLPHQILDKLTSPAFAASPNGDFVAKNRVFEATLPKEIQGQVKIAKSKSLEFSPISTKTSQAKSIGAKVVYEEAYPSNDIQYETTEKGIKESIIIKSIESVQNEYKFKFKSTDLKATLNDDNSITFTQISKEAPRDIPVSDGSKLDAKKSANYLPDHPQIFKIPSPIMIDANGNKSKITEVKVILNDNILTLIPSKQWLKDAKFPVVLDPTVEVAPQIVEELAEKRTPTAKEFLNDDGSFTSVIFQNPIHYKDLSGKYRDIDRTFVESNDPSFQYQVNTGMYIAKLKKTISGSSDINLDFGNSSIGFSPAKIGWSNGTNLGNLANVTGAISSDKSKISYKSVFGITGIDLEAIYDNEKFLKETVVNNKEAIQVQSHTNDNLEITFNLDIPTDVELKVNDKIWDKNSSIETEDAISVIKNGQPISELRKAIVYSSKDNKTQTIKVRLAKKGNQLTLTKIIPASWLNSASYPIRTDTTDTIYGIAGDGYLDSQDYDAQVTQDGQGITVATLDASNIQVGQDDNGSSLAYAYEGFIGFNTSSIGSDPVTAVTLSLYLQTDLSTIADFTHEVRLKSWSSGGLGTDDWVSGGASSTYGHLDNQTLLASISTAGIGATGAYKDLTSVAAFISNINGSGNTELIMNSNRHRVGTYATGDEYVIWQDADTAGTTQDPKLVVVHTSSGGANIGPGVNIGPGTSITTN